MGRVTDVTLAARQGVLGANQSLPRKFKMNVLRRACELDLQFRNGTQSGSRLTRIVRTSDEFCQHDKRRHRSNEGPKFASLLKIEPFPNFLLELT